MNRFRLLLIQALAILSLVRAECDINCKICSESGISCGECEEGFILSYSSPKTCICPAGHYLAEGATSCTICPEGTSALSGSTECLPCDPGFIAPAGSPLCEPCGSLQIPSASGSSCIDCPEGFFASGSPTECIACPPGQRLSLGTGAAEGNGICTPCFAGYYLNSPATSCKTCPPGYYSFMGAAECSSCPAGEFPTDPGPCAPCAQGLWAEPGDPECYCPAGKILDQGTCVPCGPNLWSNFRDTVCSLCPAGTVLDANQGGCVACAPGLWSNSGDLECSTCPAGSVVDAGQSGCVKCGSGLWAELGDLVCSSCVNNCDVCESSDTCKKCSSSTKLINGVCFLSCGQFASAWGCIECSANCQECKSASECTVCKEGYTLELDHGSYICSSSKTSTSTEVAAQSAAVGLSATSTMAKSVSAGSSSTMSFGVVAKLVRNARYFSIKYSNKTRSIFKVEEESSSFELKAPASFEHQKGLKEPHGNFMRYNVEPNFLINYWGSLIPILILVGCFTVLEMIKIYLGQSRKRKILTNKLVATFQVTAGNFLVNNLYGSFDQIVLYFILEAQTCSFDSGFAWASFICALVCLIVGIGFFGFHFYILKKYQAAKENNDDKGKKLEAFKLEYAYVKVLFKDFKDESLAQQSFLASFMLRASLLNVLLCLFVDHPVVEGCLYLIVNLTFAVFLVAKRPFEKFQGALAQYFCETIILITYTGVLVLAVMDSLNAEAESSRRNLENMIVTLGIVLNLRCTVFQCIDILASVYEAYKSFIVSRRSMKIAGAPVGAISKAIGDPDLTFMKVKKKNTGLASLKVSPRPLRREEDEGGLVSISGSPTRLIPTGLDTEMERLDLPSTSKSLHNLFMHTEGSQTDLDNGRSMMTNLPPVSIIVMEEKERVDYGLRVEGVDVVISVDDNSGKVNRQKGRRKNYVLEEAEEEDDIKDSR